MTGGVADGVEPSINIGDDRTSATAKTGSPRVAKELKVWANSLKEPSVFLKLKLMKAPSWALSKKGVMATIFESVH